MSDDLIYLCLHCGHETEAFSVKGGATGKPIEGLRLCPNCSPLNSLLFRMASGSPDV